MNDNRAGIAAVAVCLAFLAYVFGIATAQFNLWPNAFFTSAKSAFIAVLDVAEGQAQAIKVTSMEFLETEGYTEPTVINHAAPESLGNELIFVDGGNNQLRSHCPERGCIAWLMDRSGMIKHVWDIGPDLIWEDISKVSGFDIAEHAYSVGAHMFPNGDLLVTYQGWKTFPYGLGMARFDKDSQLLWKKENFAHHWLSVDDTGQIYAAAFRAVELPYQVGETNLQIDCPNGGMYEDVILVLDADGNTIEEISLLEAFINSAYSGVVFQHRYPDRQLPLTANDCDPLHLNDIQVITMDMAADSALLNPGDMLISLRSTNSVAVIDGATKRVKWLSTGHTVQQHSPRYLGNDEVLIFDNLGGRARQGGSQLVRVNMLDDSAKTLFPLTGTNDGVNFLSATAGQIALTDDKSRALVSLTRQGRSLEIDLENGQILWEYVNTHDVSHLIPGEDGAPAYGRFATQTLQYVTTPEFTLNGGRAGR